MRQRRLDETLGQDPTGADAIPYDQTNPVQPDVGAPPGGAPGMGDQTGALPPDMGAGAPPPDAGGMPLIAQAGAAGGLPPTTDAMSDVDLASLGAPVQGLQSPEDQQVAQMEQALSDPNTSPDERSAIEAQLAIAARRRMAGIGGLG